MKKSLQSKNYEYGANAFSRRRFLKLTGISTLGLPFISMMNPEIQGVSLFADNTDPVVSSIQVNWAVKELEKALKSRETKYSIVNDIAQTDQGSLCIVIGSTGSNFLIPYLNEFKITIPALPEALGIVPLKAEGKNLLLVCGHDQNGLVYALLELADRINYSSNPLETLSLSRPVVEQPSNEIRSINRMFVSEVEDKTWYYDKEMWLSYLTMITTQRFNRFSLSFGMGYDFLQNVKDAYFVFAYPFLISVEGYNVRVPQLSSKERDRNLEMLKYISEEAKKRGLHFQLGLWMHGYEWLNSPDPNYTIEGITKENHGFYCRDAIRTLLKECPAIDGITLRVHGESGVTEGSYGFWQLVFDGIAACGRKVEIDLHSKGINQEMIDLAVATGMPVVISPKYWAEHMGMPYHQADIRALEIPKAGQKTMELMNLSQGSRSFTRYGYGDLLKENRPYKVIYRVWSGTRRMLLWGDPVTAAAHSKSFSFCGSSGFDLMEPLSFKGRRGSGIAGDRCAYANESLKTKWDWQKYLYTTRIFGRIQYNPEANPDVWQRYLNKVFGPSSSAVEQSLACATRILPIVLTAHGASAANNSYWPEIYTNQPIASPDIKHPYSDTPAPKLFGNVSPFDPQLFYSINEYAGDLLKDEFSGKYSPVEVAQWIEDYAREAEENLFKARKLINSVKDPEFRRLDIDISIQIGIGRFFGAKFRTGVLYGLYEKTGDRFALEQAIIKYKKARNYWAAIADMAKEVYQADITAGEQSHLRGHWADRLPAIDKDIDYMTQLYEKKEKKKIKTETKKPSASQVYNAVAKVLGIPCRPSFSVFHNSPEYYVPGKPVELSFSSLEPVISVRLFYRHVNQGERYLCIEMIKEANNFNASIPAEYTLTEYPLQYYFVISEGPSSVCLYPGFKQNLDNQPYFVIRKGLG